VQKHISFRRNSRRAFRLLAITIADRCSLRRQLPEVVLSAGRPLEAVMKTFRSLRLAALFVVFALSLAITTISNAQDGTGTAPHVFEDSPAGLQAQFADITRIARSNDRAALQATLDSLGMPDATTWFAAHFDARYLAQLNQDYSKALSAFQSHVSWVMGNFAKFDDFALKVESSEVPLPLRDAGFESLLARPQDATKIENFRFTSTSPNDKHGPPSWVSSFVYVDGRFRIVGGTFPFWAEGLNALRGPMSMPPAVIDGMTVQGKAYREDQNRAGITAIVRMKIEVDRKGRVSHISVVSGDKQYVELAKKYLKSADFGEMPDIPGLANARRAWDYEVAVFSPPTSRAN
jgi:hypothetical protein